MKYVLIIYMPHSYGSNHKLKTSGLKYKYAKADIAQESQDLGFQFTLLFISNCTNHN